MDIFERSLREFRIFLTVEDAICLLVTFLRISCLASVDHQNRKPRIIFNYREAPDKVTLAVNASSDKSLPPKTMQFSPCLARRLQRIWEADLKEVPI